MTLNIYPNLCAEYYGIAMLPPTQQAIDFYLNYAQDACGTILEPMCGTGRYLIPLMQAHVDIYGTDASIHMLNVLKETCQSKNLKPNVRQELLQDLKEEERYHLVIIPDGSLTLIIDINLLKTSLTKIYKSLVKEGKFVFELILYHKNDESSFTSIHDMTQKQSLLFNEYYFTDNRIRHSIRRYELIDTQSHKILETQVEREKLRYYTPQEMYDLLDMTGFSQIKIKEPANEDDVHVKTIAYECIKS